VLHAPLISSVLTLCFVFFWQQTRGQKVLDWMVASITGIQSPLNFFLVPHFQNICYLSLGQDFALHFGDETATYT
jgi:hypothetical protein